MHFFLPLIKLSYFIMKGLIKTSLLNVWGLCSFSLKIFKRQQFLNFYLSKAKKTKISSFKTKYVIRYPYENIVFIQTYKIEYWLNWNLFQAEVMEVETMMEQKRTLCSVDESALTSLTPKRHKTDFSISSKVPTVSTSHCNIVNIKFI